MSDEMFKDIKTGLEELHKKAEAGKKETAEFKAQLDKVSQDIKSFEEEKAKKEAERKADQERFELIEKHLAKSGKSDVKIDVKEINSLIADGFKNASTKEEMSIYASAMKTRSATEGSEGGNLITQELMMGMMLTRLRDSNPILSEATVITKNPVGSIRLPIKELTFGAHSAGEKQTSTGRTKRTIRLTDITMSRYYTEEDTTDEFLRAQTVESESTIAADLTQDLGWTIQYDMLFGDGMSKPFGLLKESFLFSTAFASSGQSGASTRITWTDLFNVQRQFNYEKYRNRGKFYLSFAALTDLLVEKDTQGRPLYMPGINGSSQSTIAGKQFVIMPDMDQQLASNTIPILFGDMKAAYIVLLNNQYNVYRDEITNRREGILSIGLSTYAGGSVWDKEAIRAVKGV